MNKKITAFLIICCTVSAFVFGFIEITNDKNPDRSPFILDGRKNIQQSDTNQPAGFPYPVQWNYNHETIPGVGHETVGALKFGGYYILNRWTTPNMIFRINPNGPNGGPGTLHDSVSYTGSIRDMTIAPDGSGTEFLWGGKASTILYKMNATGQVVSQYTLTGGGNIRAIAWDKNRKGFWYTDFSGNLTCRDTANNVKGLITSALTGKYGMAFDSTSTTDSAFVWVWAQGTGGTTCELVKYHAATGTLKATYIFTLPSTVGIAGGAEIQVIDNKLMLLLNYQEMALVGYKMKDVVVGIDPVNNIIPDNYSLEQNYPNPFNPVTKIKFALPVQTNVKLKVYDASGRMVTSIINETKPAGNYEVSFDGTSLSSGIYFYTIDAGNFSDVKRMILLK